jgi:nitroreductase
METFDCIEKRRSIRQFKDTPIEWEKIGNILRAAQLAPTAGNIQDFKLVVVSDKNKISALANAAMKQYWITQAPILIVIYSEPDIIKKYYGLRGEKLYTVQNSAAAMENMLLAATAQGLASCWVGAFDEAVVNNILGAPDSVRPQAIIVIGYSDSQPPVPKRYKLVDIVYMNAWKSKYVNVDLMFDEFSDVGRVKIQEMAGSFKKTTPIIGKVITEKSKEGLAGIHKKIKEKIDERRKKKEEKVEKELGDEEEVLEDSD